MITKIIGEQPFQVLANNFSISPSNEGYTLQISADGKQYSNLFTVGAGVTRLVTGVAANSYYRLSGNQSNVSINWMKTCVTEGGGDSSELQPIDYFPLDAVEGTVISYTGSSSASGVYQFDGTEWTEVGGNTEEIELPIAAAVNDLKSNIDVRLDQQYYKKKEVDNIAARKTEPGQVDIQIKNYVDPAIAEVNETIVDKELPVSAALNELNQKISEISGGSGGDMSAYWTSAQTEEAISAATAGKADASNITGGIKPVPSVGQTWFPVWNKQGIITGTSKKAYTPDSYINGKNKVFVDTNGNGGVTIYAPENTGTAGDILVSTGNGAPVWTTDNKVSSTYVSTIWKGTQAEYDAITTKDPNTFYIIVNN